VKTKGLGLAALICFAIIFGGLEFFLSATNVIRTPNSRFGAARWVIGLIGFAMLAAGSTGFYFAVRKIVAEALLPAKHSFAIGLPVFLARRLTMQSVLAAIPYAALAAQFYIAARHPAISPVSQEGMQTVLLLEFLAIHATPFLAVITFFEPSSVWGRAVRAALFCLLLAVYAGGAYAAGKWFSMVMFLFLVLSKLGANLLHYQTAESKMTLGSRWLEQLLIYVLAIMLFGVGGSRYAATSLPVGIWYFSALCIVELFVLYPLEWPELKRVEVGGKTARVPTRGPEAQSAWMDAAGMGDLRAMKRLGVESDVDVNCVDANGANALHFAAARGDLEMARWLAEEGCDPCRKERLGHTPADIARMRGVDAAVVEEFKKLEAAERRRIQDLVSASSAFQATVALEGRPTVLNLSACTIHRKGEFAGNFDVVVRCDPPVAVDTILKQLFLRAPGTSSLVAPIGWRDSGSVAEVTFFSKEAQASGQVPAEVEVIWRERVLGKTKTVAEEY
jgi:hypothetical protein